MGAACGISRNLGARPFATVGCMAQRLATWIAGGTAAVALTASLLVLWFGSYEPGVDIIDTESGLVVGSVAPYSPAARDGITEGMVVVGINGIGLYRLPGFEYPEPDPETPDIVPDPVLVGPSRPTPIEVAREELARLAAQPIGSLDLANQGELDGYSAESGCCIYNFYYPGDNQVREATLALLPGLAILLLGAWWLDSGRAGESLRALALPGATAAATPFLVQPVMATFSPGLVILAGLLILVGTLPLAVALAERIEDERDRRRAMLGIPVLTAVGLSMAVLLVTEGPGYQIEFLRWIVIGAIPLLPGLAAAGPLGLDRLRGGAGGSGRVLRSTELALVGATPLFALATDQPPYLWPFALWLIGIALAGRFTIRPLARLATRAQLQRDLVVAATEAERARVAADIHDDALQELTLLVRRLETAGDTEGADLGRTIADRLRAICGDLRLPILDDLGVGPALDWLVLRIERLAGGEVRLERADGTRPPADVELAIFRIAQEALANAVKHGRPPIVVRYRATDSGVSLSIDDAGPGIDEHAGEAAEQAGRFGLLNMQQRAEQIGAILDIRRWPTGGTHVALEWRPR
jgi:signal transduction histidine kinase